MVFDNMTTFSGFFYIDSKKKGEKSVCLETVISWNPFWGNTLQQPSYTPFSHNNNVLKYLEMFELNDPASFCNHFENSNMDLKLWEKTENPMTELMIIPISLHPFYSAFSNPTLINQFYKEKMPIWLSTEWIDVNYGYSHEGILSATLQVVLAIGNPDQLENLKRSRNITVPITADSRKLAKSCPIVKNTSQSGIANMLSNFIDNLALSLPKRSESDAHQHYPPEPRTRRTSDLLDVLQNALKNPIPATLMTSHSSQLPPKVNANVTNVPEYDSNAMNIRVLINVGSARNIVQTNEQHSVGSYYRNPNSRNLEKNDKPSTYVSFEAINCDKPDKYSSYRTKIAPHTSDPFWNEQFDVMLPVVLFQQENTNFYLNLWRKVKSKQTSYGSKQVDEAEMIGYSIINLSSLTPEANISGYFNIVDNAGRINGQIKIKITIVPIKSNESNNIFTEESVLSNDFRNSETYDVDNLLLNRTLKRKFTELEEINQRLKSRLLDVTTDHNFDIDDEFENDLNTCPDEDEMDSEHEFDWNRFSNLEIHCNRESGDTRHLFVDNEEAD